MPYTLRKAPKRDLYWVVNKETGKKYSKEPIPKQRAEAQMRALYMNEKEMRGAGFWDDVAAIGKRIGNAAVSVYNKLRPMRSKVGIAAYIGKTVTGLLTPKKLNPPSRRWFEANKDYEVIGITAQRNPVSKWIELFLNLVSSGQWEAAKRQIGYDKMFHLALKLELRRPDGTTKQAKIEKLSQLNFTDDVAPEPNTETADIPVLAPIRVADLLGKTEQAMGQRFYTYDAFNNNCQMFVMAVLEANGLATPEARAFIFQPVDKLLEQQPEWTQNFSRTITNLGSITDRIFKGYGEPATHRRFIEPPSETEEHKRLLGVLKGFESEAARGCGRSSPSLEGGKSPRGSFRQQLAEAGMTEADYLRKVRAAAKRNGYNPQSLHIAEDGIHKVEIEDERGHMSRFGRVGYGDYILWKALEAQGKTPKGTAAKKRRVFHRSHERIQGDWRSDPYSPNNLSLRLLW